MTRRAVVCGVLVLSAGCRDLALPAPPDPTRPGTISGRTVTAQPGAPQLAPLPKVRVELLGTGRDTSSDDNGYFLLDGVQTGSGELLFSSDLDGDGQGDRQKLLTLDALRAGPGRDVSLGEVQLVQSAAVRGQVRLGDVSSVTGHAGTLVFMPQGPFTATSSDDGSFILPNLPEGTFSLTFFHAGYQAAGVDRLSLEGGQELTLRLTSLRPQPSTPDPVGLAGRVLLNGGAPATGAEVTLLGMASVPPALVGADGQFTFSALSVGVYGLAVRRSGSSPVLLSNLLLLRGTTTIPDVVLRPAPDGGSIEPTTDAGQGSTIAPGQTPRVRVVPFGAGADAGCAQAGYAVEVGIDSNGNGQLDPAEVTSRDVVCVAPSVLVTAAPATDCPTGGVALQSWADANLDGRYEPGEELGTPRLLCGTAPATDGGTWTWMSGSSGSDQLGVYGTQGTASPGNTPGGRGYAASWVDEAGRRWLFGGLGHGASTLGHLNDLWMFDGVSWTWMRGSSAVDQAGVYGTQGLGSPSNTPGARLGATSWTDAKGWLWLFGGNGGGGDFNDLWTWNSVDWVWMGGSSEPNTLGTYGTVGAPGSVPGAREYAASAIGPSGVFVFGGIGYASTATAGDLNDLWRWDGTSWTWLSGSKTVGQASVYGTLGVASPSNVPGARSWSATWVDQQGNLWLFGGYDGATKGHLNDLWRWDNTNWTWVGGANVVDQRGVYGTLGSPSPTGAPGGRWGATSWVDASGIVWLFGGSGYDATGALGNLNDLWKFDGKVWTWMGGSSTADPPGDHGTSGVPAASNVPGGRAFGVSWPQRDGTLWLFGGLGPGLLNDLWRYQP